jgi:hypothetical protein
MKTTPTLSGAQHGCFRPYREVPGGIWLDTKDQGVINRSCALQTIRRAVSVTCADYARQYLSSRGDKSYHAGQLGELTLFFRLHYALIEVPTTGTYDTEPVLLYPVPGTLADANGKLNSTIVSTLPLNDLVDGQMDRLSREFELLRETETPDRAPTHTEWEAIVNEGKEQSLRTLHSRYGSSALIQVLHGLGAAPWPE